MFADDTTTRVSTVVWATGFHRDHSWINLPEALNDNGHLRHVRGITPAAGLYVLGHPWQHTAGSALLGFVSADAAYLADHIASDCLSHAGRPVCEDTESMDRQAMHEEMERARASFHQLLNGASDADLRRQSDGTRWNNKQLLFHMLLGYLIVRALRGLVLTFDRLPAATNRRFARLLNAVTVPFDAVNYAGSWLAGSVLSRRTLNALFDRTITALQRRLNAETEEDLARTMQFPTRWDPFFRETMTLANVYHFPTQHFDFHRDQLTLNTG